MDKQPQKLILIVDDHVDDQGILVWTLGKLGIANPILPLWDGHEAVRYLNGDGCYANREEFPLPAAMFLDLQMPVMNGWEVLDWINTVILKREMRIFVYSSPRNVEEVNKLYSLGADSFLKKPVREMDLKNLIANFPQPWEFKPPILGTEADD